MPARIAPLSFIEEVKRIDRSLDVEWSDKHDRWFVYQTSYVDGRKIYLIVVQNEDKSYRDLDGRVIAELARMFFKDPEVPDVVEYMKKKDEEAVKEQERKLDDLGHDFVDYNWNRIADVKTVAFGNTLKHEETIR